MHDTPKSPRNETTLQMLRRRRKLSLSQIGNAIGASPSSVHYWETYQKEPGPQFRARYAAALRLTVGSLGRILYEGSVGLDGGDSRAS